MKWKKFLVVVLVMSTIMLLQTTNHSVNTHAKTEIEQAQDAKEQLEEEKKELELKIASLEKDKDNVLTYIEKLDSQLNELEQKIASTQKDISSVEANLDTTREELEEAKKTEDTQYEAMKLRIKYMYENGSEDYFEMLFSSESVSDFLNRAEYVSKISEYDKNLLDRYEQTKLLIEKKETELVAQRDKLSVLKEQLDVEEKGMETLMANKEKELSVCTASIRESQNSIVAVSNKIEQQEQVIEDLFEEERRRVEEEERKRKEEEEKKKQEEANKNNANNTGNSGDNNDKEDAKPSASGYTWPVPGRSYISSPFGYRIHPILGYKKMHNGIDIPAPTGTKTVSMKSGKVSGTGYNSSAGKYVRIYHGNGMYSVYYHLSAIYVKTNQEVSGGQAIGAVGNTGGSTGPHLHFGVMVNGSYVNPLNYVKRP